MTEISVGAEEAIAQVADGRLVVVTDHAGREDEADLVCAAELATPAVVAAMARDVRGLICLALEDERCDELALPPLPRRGATRFGTPFTVSIEARRGVTTGISAHDRARTIAVASDPAATAADLVRPGHVFPLRARPGGVLERAGHTEAAVDLARLAGRRPAGVVCTILDDEGTPARGARLSAFCRAHGLSVVSIAALAAYRRRTERLVERVTVTRVPTEHGDFEAVGYRDRHSGAEHLALVRGSVAGRADVLARLHRQCLTGDALGGASCGCGRGLRDALQRIGRDGAGVLVYVTDEGRGTGGVAGAGAQILRELGVRGTRLMTDDPAEVAALEAHGIRVTGRAAPAPERRGAGDRGLALAV